MNITEAMLQTSITEERNRLAALCREDVTCLQAALGPAAAQDMLVEIHAALTMEKEDGHTFDQHRASVGAHAMVALDVWTTRAIDSQMSTFDALSDARERLAEQER
jgi:hypothetical protein